MLKAFEHATLESQTRPDYEIKEDTTLLVTVLFFFSVTFPDFYMKVTTAQRWLHTVVESPHQLGDEVV
jgi:hypothetical protein